MTKLIQSQAMLLQNEALFLSQISTTSKAIADIKLELEMIKAILMRHEEMLQKLPEAIREKIGDAESEVQNLAIE